MRGILKDKSFCFSIEVVALCKSLSDQKEFALSKQLLRSGTAIGALIREAEFAQSSADFISKLSIALKEANETIYWLELLYKSDYIDALVFENNNSRAKELVSMLVSSIKTMKAKNEKIRNT